MANRRRPVVPPKAGATPQESGTAESSPSISGSQDSGSRPGPITWGKPTTSHPEARAEPALSADSPESAKPAQLSKQEQAAERRKAAAERRAAAAEARKQAAAEKAAAKAKEQAEKQAAADSASQTRQLPAVRPSAVKQPAKSRPVQPGTAAVTTGTTRTARLRLVHVDPWSVMKTAFLLSIALGIVMIVAVTIIWGVLGAAGVWDSINSSVRTTVGSDTSTPFDITDYIGAGRVIGFTMVAAVIDVVVLTALATLGAFIYNLAATLLGGVEMTLAEDR